MGRLPPEQQDFGAYFERWMDFGYAFKVVASMWPHRDEPHLIWLRYEDMKADLRREARRLATFLHWDVTEAELDRVLPLVSLERMQQVEDRERATPGRRSVWQPGTRFFREGKVGKNRARLTPEQEARILERARAELAPACFDFVMRLDR
jgi:hypothetical protein